MKFLLIIFLFIGSVCKAQDFSCHRAKEIGGNNQQFLKSPQKKDRKIDVQFASCKFLINPSEYRIQGSVATTFRVVEKFQKTYVDFNSEMEIDSIIENGQRLSFEKKGRDELWINFNDSLEVGTEVTVEIHYNGSPALIQEGSLIQSSHNEMPIMWTKSEPFGAKDWWPCVESLDDKYDSIEVILDVPIGNIGISNGLLKDSLRFGDRQHFHWKHNYPIAAYLVAFAVTNYDFFIHKIPYKNGNLEVHNYVYPESKSTWETQIVFIDEMMTYFVDVLGDYPFDKEKYGHAEFNWGGGMEHQTVSFMKDLNYTLMAHELAHQWFGNKITCDDWSDIWLNESFATYLTALVLENELDDNQEAWNNWKFRTKEFIFQRTPESVWVDDVSNVQRIFNYSTTYLKGARVLHMLRWEIGEEVFFNALKSYAEDVRFCYQYASTDNLKTHFEMASGKDLTAFFDYWIYGKDTPTFQLKWEEINTGELSIDLTQKGRLSEAIVFVKVPVLISFRDGSDTMIYLNSSGKDQFVFEFEQAVWEVEIDPDDWILTNEKKSLEKFNSEGFKVSFFYNEITRRYIFQSEFKSGSIEQFRVYDVNGKEVGEYKGEGNNYVKELDLTAFSNGIYFIKFRSFQKEEFLIKLPHVN